VIVTRKSAGFFGLMLGSEYYFSDKNSLDIDIGALSDNTFEDFNPDYESSIAYFGAFQIGSNYKNFHFGLGLQYNNTSYTKRVAKRDYSTDMDSININKYQNNLGLAFSTYYRISNSFDIGFKYLPSLFCWDNKFRMHYSHLLFFELVFNKELYRPEK
jgi:hypothetical protein